MGDPVHKSELPDLPKKTRVKPDHLSFREPGNKSARRRREELETEIKLLQDEKGRLEQEAASLKSKCQKELKDAQGRSNNIPGRGLRHAAMTVQQAFDETVAALMEVTSSDSNSEPAHQRESGTLERVRRDITDQEERLDIAERKVRIADLKLVKMEDQLNTLQEEIDMPADKDALDAQMHSASSSDGDDDDQEHGEEFRQEEASKGANGNGPDEKDGARLNETTDVDREIEEQAETAETAETAPRSIQNGESIEAPVSVVEDERNENGSNERLSRQTQAGDENKGEIEAKRRTQAREARIMMQRRKLEILKKEIDTMKNERKDRKEARDEVEGELFRLKEQEKELRNDEKMRLEEERKEADRNQLRQENDEDAEEKRVEEWESKLRRQELLREAQVDIRRHVRRKYIFRWEYMDELEERDLHESEELRKLERNMEDVKTLESLITKARRLRDKIDRVSDLRDILQTESDRENQWLAWAAKLGPSYHDAEASAEGKDHLNSNPLAEFKLYKALEPGQVRLLYLMPAPKDHSYYPLICTLQTHSWKKSRSVPKAPKYAALSYYWGPNVDCGRLFVLRDGLPKELDAADWGTTAKRAIRVPIRDNLFRALLRLRRHDHPVALWVDYVCINQKDAGEKTEQLGNMVDVYQNAENVCVWLGEADFDGRSDDAMEFIPSIMDFAVLDRHAKDKLQADKWNALAELMRDRWFSRRWVVQEISLARSATVHCGAKMVHWSDFADAVSLLASNQNTIKKLFDFSKWREGPKTLGDVQSFGAYILLKATSKLFLRKEKGGIKTPNTTIQFLVTSLKTFDTSDRRDLVYSLVSIASDTSTRLAQHPTVPTKLEPLTIDYEWSAIKVFREFTRFCIQSSSSLDIICRPWAMPAPTSERAEQPEVMPSWIPLLSNSEYGTPSEVYSGRKHGESLVGRVGSARYKASGASSAWEIEPRFGMSEEAQVTNGENSASPADHGDTKTSGSGVMLENDHEGSLFVHGFKFARIKNVSARNTGGVILQESLRMGSWKGIQNRDDSVPDKIWRTLVADRDAEGQLPPTWYQRACLRCLEIADTFNNGDLNVGEILQGHSEMLREYLTRVRNVTWNRRFFTATSTNRKPYENENENEDADAEKPNENEDLDDQKTSKDLALDPEEVIDTSDEAAQMEKSSNASQSEAGASESDSSRDDDEDDDSSDDSHGDSSRGDDEDGDDENDEENEEGQESSMTRNDSCLFGLGPPKVEAGDYVCILYNCSVPVILREIESVPSSYYELIGEAYVHGKMEGEAINDFIDKLTWGEKKEVFELR